MEEKKRAFDLHRSAPQIIRAETVVWFWKKQKKKKTKKKRIIVLPGIGCVTRSDLYYAQSRLPHTCAGIYRRLGL